MNHHSITSLPPSPEAERHERMLKYSISMAVRLVCVVALFFVHGWWLLAPALGAVFLPYFAVVVANASRSGAGGTVERPGSIVRRGDDAAPGEGEGRARDDR